MRISVMILLPLQMEPRTTNVRSPLSLGLHSSQQQQMGLGNQGIDYLNRSSNGLEGHARNSSNDLRLGSPNNDLMSNNNNADHIMNSQQGMRISWFLLARRQGFCILFVKNNMVFV